MSGPSVRLRRPLPPRLRPVRVAAAMAVAVVGAGVAGGCSGDSGPALSSWITAADEICVEVQREAVQLRPVLSTPTPVEILRRSAELSKKEAGRLRDIERPADRRDDVRAYIAALDERIVAIDAYIAELNAGQRAPEGAGPSGVENLTTATQKAADQALALGLRHCLAGIDMSIGGAAGSNTQGTGAVPSSFPTGGPSIPVSIPGDVSPTIVDPSPNGTGEFGTVDGAGEN